MKILKKIYCFAIFSCKLSDCTEDINTDSIDILRTPNYNDNDPAALLELHITTVSCM